MISGDCLQHVLILRLFLLILFIFFFFNLPPFLTECGALLDKYTEEKAGKGHLDFSVCATEIVRAAVLSCGLNCFSQTHWMRSICLWLPNEWEMHILHAHVITKVWTCLYSVSGWAPSVRSSSQNNGGWKPRPVLLIKQPVLADLLHHSFEQWQVEHVMGVPHMVFVFPVSRTGSKILKDWNACYRYLHAHASIFCSLVLLKVNSQG